MAAPRATHAVPAQTLHLPPRERALVDAALAAAERDGWARRLWAKDASLWTGKDEARWLGWLDLLPARAEDLAAHRALADEARREGLTDAVLLGMGGSSMCPELLAFTFGARPGSLRVHILDSTDPAQVRAAEAKIVAADTATVLVGEQNLLAKGRITAPNLFLN